MKNNTNMEHRRTSLAQANTPENIHAILEKHVGTF